MADTYGVTPGDIAGEMTTLVPSGFSVSTTPTIALVTSWISDYDTLVTLAVQRAAAQVPAAADQAARLAKRYITAAVKAEVMRTLYLGNDPERAQAAATPYAEQAAMLLTQIDALGEQMTGTANVTGRLRVPDTSDPRALVLDDTVLGATSVAGRTKAY